MAILLLNAIKGAVDAQLRKGEAAAGWLWQRSNDPNQDEMSCLPFSRFIQLPNADSMPEREIP